MTELSVIDVIAVHTLEEGDIFRLGGYEFTVLDTLDRGGNVIITYRNQYDDTGDTSLDPFLQVDLLGYVSEEVTV